MLHIFEPRWYIGFVGASVVQESKEKKWWNEREQAAQRWLKWLKVMGVVLVLYGCYQFWLSHKASELQGRAQAMGGQLEIGGFPFKGVDLYELEQKLEVSESLYGRFLELKPRAELLEGTVDFDVFPYTEQQLTEYEKQILASEALQAQSEMLSGRAKVMGWTLEWSTPLTQEQLELVEQQVVQTEQLYAPVNHLERKYKSKLAFPYTQQAYERFDFEHYYLKPALVEAGEFQQGSELGDSDEQPTHKVTLEHSFWMMTEELTQLAYLQISKSNPSGFESCGETCPVERLSWRDAVRFSNLLNIELDLEPCYEIEDQDVIWTKGYTCKGWRLPTESEWEYAAKARDISLYSGGDRIDQLAWYLVNSEQRTHPVGLKGGNRSKLVDMSGNVAEWVWDRYAPYNSDDKINPKGASSGEKRGVRGGSWASAAWGTRVTFRDFKHPDTTTKQIGVRLCKTHFSQ